jgi:hypothetical protein
MVHAGAMTLAATLLLVVGTGCNNGYHWQMRDPLGAEQRAREEGKVLFIFYQLWAEGQSNRMKGPEVLSDPAVEAEFKDTVNVLIDRDFGSMYVSYVRRYNVNTYPACILVAPDGTSAVRTGVVPRQELIEWVRAFKAQAGKRNQNTEKPPTVRKQNAR